MRALVVAVVAFFIVTPVTAAPASAEVQVRKIDVTDYGIYTSERQSSKRDASGVLRSVAKNFRLAVSTTRIPAQRGLTFGFAYVVVGAPEDALVELRKVTIYPPQGLRSPAVSQVLHRNEIKLRVKIGRVRYTAYTFDDPWELVPGPWTIQLWYGNRKLAEKKFTVVAP